jgi:hypothetical protein
MDNFYLYFVIVFFSILLTNKSIKLKYKKEIKHDKINSLEFFLFLSLKNEREREKENYLHKFSPIQLL